MFVRDLRASFLEATKAEGCIVKLAPRWREVVGQWLGAVVGEPVGSDDDTSAVPVSWIKIKHDGPRTAVHANLLLGGASAARVIVTTRKKRGLARILRTLTTFVPQVSSRLCLRWLRDEANLFERQHLVHDLHDGPLQVATAAKIRLQSSRQTISDPVAAKALDDAIALTGEVVTSMRALLKSRASTSDADSLETHLRRAVGRWAELTGMRVHFRFADRPAASGPFSRETLDVAERVVSESIINAWKHGKATELSVRCRPANGGMLLTLTDDGCGVRAAVEQRRHEGANLGLRLLRSRVHNVGGRFAVRSPDGGGTVVETWLPPRQPDSRDPA